LVLALSSLRQWDLALSSLCHLARLRQWDLALSSRCHLARLCQECQELQKALQISALLQQMPPLPLPPLVPLQLERFGLAPLLQWVQVLSIVHPSFLLVLSTPWLLLVRFVLCVPLVLWLLLVL
jgi:hypothetical protein